LEIFFIPGLKAGAFGIIRGKGRFSKVYYEQGGFDFSKILEVLMDCAVSIAENGKVDRR